MLILTIRTDKPEAELGMFENSKGLIYETWTAHRQLAESLHAKIRGLLTTQGKQLHDVEAIVCYQGPGSFTGLRIGLTVANTLAYALEIPCIAEAGDGWMQNGITRALAGETDNIAMPEYGAEANITLPRQPK